MDDDSEGDLYENLIVFTKDHLRQYVEDPAIPGFNEAVRDRDFSSAMALLGAHERFPSVANYLTTLPTWDREQRRELFEAPSDLAVYIAWHCAGGRAMCQEFGFHYLKEHRVNDPRAQAFSVLGRNFRMLLVHSLDGYDEQDDEWMERMFLAAGVGLGHFDHWSLHALLDTCADFEALAAGWPQHTRQQKSAYRKLATRCRDVQKLQQRKAGNAMLTLHKTFAPWEKIQQK